MGTTLLKLHNRLVSDRGTVVADHQMLVDMALDGEHFAHIPFVEHHDTVRYHLHYGGGLKWIDTGDMSGPTAEMLAWNIPEEYSGIDIREYLFERLEETGLTGDEYRERLSKEIERFHEQGMVDFVRVSIWIKDVMDRNQMVYGTGRGSTCSLLSYYLIGLTMVDPVLHDIDMEEFFGSFSDD